MTAPTLSSLPQPLSLLLDILRASAGVSDAAFREALLRVAEEVIRQGRTFDWLLALQCEVALAGHAESAHRLREAFFGTFADTKALVRYVIQEAARAGVEGHEVARLESEATALEKKVEALRASWQTADDLESIAAQRLVPPDAELRATRDSLPFPQGWLESSPKPF